MQLSSAHLAVIARIFKIVPILCLTLGAQERDMTNVKDVLGGQRTVLLNQDLYTWQAYGTSISLSESLTVNSRFAQPSATAIHLQSNTMPCAFAMAPVWLWNATKQY